MSSTKTAGSRPTFQRNSRKPEEPQQTFKHTAAFGKMGSKQPFTLQTLLHRLNHLEAVAFFELLMAAEFQFQCLFIRKVAVGNHQKPTARW